MPGVHPFTTTPKEAVASLGEQRLIAAIRRWLGSASPQTPFGIGDDCAVVHASPHRQLVTVDPVIYGAHFDDSVPARAVGAKLLKRNLSDIAAMGGRPRAAVIALALDASVNLAWLEGFYRGLASTARRFGVAIVGGDVAQHPGGIVGTLTLIGEASGPRVITRSGARVGDWIYVTGALGGSLSTGHHWRFTPRVAEGAWLAQHRGVRAMMDLSDGLAKDIHDLTPAGAEPAIELEAVPRRRGFDLRAALSDGEDYELLFVLGSRSDRTAFERAWRRRFATPLTCIGRFVRRGDRPVNTIDLGLFHGFEHLR